MDPRRFARLSPLHAELRSALGAGGGTHGFAATVTLHPETPGRSSRGELGPHSPDDVLVGHTDVE